MEHFTADVVYAVMSSISSEVRMNEHKAVFFGPFVVTIIEECTGLYEALLLGAALLAFPTTWGKAVLGFVIGFPMIYAMNIIRICVLLAVGRYFGELLRVPAPLLLAGHHGVDGGHHLAGLGEVGGASRLRSAGGRAGPVGLIPDAARDTRRRPHRADSSITRTGSAMRERAQRKR